MHDVLRGEDASLEAEDNVDALRDQAALCYNLGKVFVA